MTLKMEAQEEALCHGGGEEVQSKGCEAPRHRGDLGGISCEACRNLLPGDFGRWGDCWSESWGWGLPPTHHPASAVPSSPPAPPWPLPAWPPALPHATADATEDGVGGTWG